MSSTRPGRSSAPGFMLIACCSWGCVDGPPSTASTQQASIYGADGRQEPFEYGDPLGRARAERSVLAMITRWDAWSFCDADAGQVEASTLGEDRGLCPGERFAAQPVIAECSSTLIDVDLVITAAHCAPAEVPCAELRFVAGLHYAAADQLRPIRRSDVYQCRQRVVKPDGRDVVIVQLDRPVAAPLEPAPVSAGARAIGDPLTIIGFPSGIPMKIAGECSVRALQDTASGVQLLKNDCETFPGNSGSGVFGEGLELVGVQHLGAGAYRADSERGCKVATVYTQDGLLPGTSTVPQFSAAEPIGPAIEALCATGWPTPLCGSAAVCGDGRCTGAETPSACATDCRASSCGDGICDLGEDRDCVADCGARGQLCEPDHGGGNGGVGDPGGCAAGTGTCGGMIWWIGVLAVAWTLSRRRPRFPR